MNRILLGTFLIYAVLTTNGRAQSATPPCTGSVIVDAERPPSLDSLVRASQLIVVGTVAEVYPPANINPQHLHIQTESLISVDQLILGSLPGKTIALAQMGGKIPPYNWTVAGDPVVRWSRRVSGMCSSCKVIIGHYRPVQQEGQDSRRSVSGLVR